MTGRPKSGLNTRPPSPGMPKRDPPVGPFTGGEIYLQELVQDILYGLQVGLQKFISGIKYSFHRLVLPVTVG